MSDEAVPPPEAPEPPRWAVDERAKKEDKNWDDEEALRGQHRANDLRWLKVYGWAVVIMTIFFLALFLLSLGAWAYHYIMPHCLGWLDHDQLSKIQSVIFSGSLGAIVSLVAQKQLHK